MIFINKFKRLLAFVFSFLFFVSGFNSNVRAGGYFNIVIVGKKGVGKSTLLHRFMTQNFDKEMREQDVPLGEYKEHGVVHVCPKDVRFRVVEIGIDEEGDYIDYLYQNANIIIHMSDIRKIPTKQDISIWYDKFVKSIFRGLGDPRGTDDSFRANPEDRMYCKKWFGPIQKKFKIGYIIFVFNKLDSLNDESFSARERCEDLWYFIDEFPNARSILSFDALSSKGNSGVMYTGAIQKELVTMNEWVYSQSVMSSFKPFDPEKKNNFLSLKSQESIYETNTKDFYRRIHTKNPICSKKVVSATINSSMSTDLLLTPTKPTNKCGKCLFITGLISGLAFLGVLIYNLMSGDSSSSVKDSTEENIDFYV